MDCTINKYGLTFKLPNDVALFVFKSTERQFGDCLPSSLVHHRREFSFAKRVERASSVSKCQPIRTLAQRMTLFLTINFHIKYSNLAREVTRFKIFFKSIENVPIAENHFTFSRTYFDNKKVFERGKIQVS